MLYGLWGRYMALEVVIWPWRSIYGLGMALGWPWRSASDDLNIGKCPWRKVWMKFIIWPLRNLSKNQYFGLKSWILALFWLQIEVYGLGGRYMASGRPRRSASSGLKRPQMTSNVLKWPQYCFGARDEKFGQKPLKPLYDLENHYMALKTVIWPWKPLYGLENR